MQWLSSEGEKKRICWSGGHFLELSAESTLLPLSFYIYFVQTEYARGSFIIRSCCSKIKEIEEKRMLLCVRTNRLCFHQASSTIHSPISTRSSARASTSRWSSTCPPDPPIRSRTIQTPPFCSRPGCRSRSSMRIPARASL